MQKSNKIKALSLFCGAGGMDCGFKKAGYQILAANEIDKTACETYKLNHPETKLVCGDINEKYNALREFPKLDAIFGGPPCQGFSVAGKMDIDDPRSKLIFAFSNMINILRPKGFVLENVKSLGTLKKFEKIRNRLFEEFEKAGYQLSMIVLNAKDFAVPQSRERVFFMGTQKKFQKIRKDDFIPYKCAPPSLRDSIKHLGPAGNRKNLRTCKAKITLATKPILRQSPYAGMLFNGQGRPLNPDGWSCTLPATMGGNRTPIIDENHLYNNKESWVEKYHKKLLKGDTVDYKEAPPFLRRLTIDEALILQTFPENYQFAGSQSKIFSQIGNAVPCKLAQVVACVLKNAIS